MGMTSKEAIAWLGNTIYDPKEGLNTTLSHELVKKCLDGLHLLEKQEQGLVQILPCKVGTTVYWLNNYYGAFSHWEITPEAAYAFRITEHGLDIDMWGGKIGVFGITVFLTQKEAEQALKEREKNETD